MSLVDMYHGLLHRLLRQTFPLWERLGLHITPNHFYQPIPDTRRLADRLWSEPSALVGIHLHADHQLVLLKQLATTFRHEYDQLPEAPTNCPWQYYTTNGSFDSVDGEMLYSMIRHFKPKRIFEVGSGHSTYLSAQAARANRRDHGIECQLTVVDPHPGPTVKEGFPGLTKLVIARIQDVPLSEFDTLDENDILFIDSSHVLAIGSDVQYEYLEIMPRLRRGVLIHAHDIFLPAEYPKDWVLREHRFWTEQYLLQAFLAFNDNFRVLWAGHYMTLTHPSALERAFASYHRGSVRPGSFWMVRER